MSRTRLVKDTGHDRFGYFIQAGVDISQVVFVLRIDVRHQISNGTFGITNLLFNIGIGKNAVHLLIDHLMK
jgi:hypothetical protein